MTIADHGLLAELALDLRWSWNHAADEIWERLEPELWRLTHNPWVVLQSAARDRIERCLRDPTMRPKIDGLVRERRAALLSPAWFQHTHPHARLAVAYFSMEFMLSEALPIYSGGLGNVAGDQLKAASDLGVPVIGIGLLYSQGYFRQVIDRNGAQQALYPYNDPGQLPITPLRGPDGEWLRLRIDLPGYPLLVRAWHVQVGRNSLYLLDSNDAANAPALRGITSELYGGGPELRLQQELLLGIGGWRLVAALGIRPEVCHLNEGHAAFAVLERAHTFMQDQGVPFELALAVTRAGNLFTTHTAVEAGFDRYDPALIAHYLGDYAELKLGISIPRLLALGRRDDQDATGPFNMAHLALHGSGAVNGVSRLHAKVSRSLFAPLFPRWPADEIPVGHVTNGIHTPSWDSESADELWTETCGKDRWLGTTQALESQFSSVTDAQLWSLRTRNRETLIAYARERLSRSLATSGASASDIEEARHLLDPGVLTLGFARRFATYKRPNLLLHDPERLIRLLANAARPVQLILAGKAHPADRPGQELIQQWTTFIRHSPARRHVIFLSDYDMLLTEQLVQGVDVWLNTPRRPWEACGTSGMKVLVNGGLNLSELDGWWAEAYSPEVGWALGDGLDHGDDPAQDALEAGALYDLLERDVIPEFYSRDQSGIPTAWVARMRNSMRQLTPQFSSNRAVRQYTEQHYLPAADRYRNRAADGCRVGAHLVSAQTALRKQWPLLRFTALKADSEAAQWRFEVRVELGPADPEAVHVELYADALPEGQPERHRMTARQRAPGSKTEYLYRITIPATRPTTDYTARVIPDCGMAVPLEESLILWQR